MDWLAFMEKKCTELMNTGHRMDDETFITHLLNSLPQSEYKGAILIIKDKLRNGTVELPEIEQILEDKYQAMKYAKGWGEEEDNYALFASLSNKTNPKKAFKGHCGYCGEFGHKAADCPNKKRNQNMGQKAKTEHRKKQSTKGDSKGRGHRDICTQYEDADEDLVVYRDQGTNTEEYERSTYGDLMRTQSKEEDKVKYNVAQNANESTLLETGKGNLMIVLPMKNRMVLVRATPQ